MSTSEDSTMKRYRKGLPPRDPSEHELYREWRQLDADDHASALGERWDPNEEYERYEGPLGWDAFLRERTRDRHLNDLGIEPRQLPAPYGQALGADRASRLQRQVEDRLVDFAYSPPNRDELSAQARQFGAAARALNVELSARVVDLERRQAGLASELSEAERDEIDLSATAEVLTESTERAERERVLAAAEAQRAEIEVLRQSRDTVRQELTGLSAHEDHPDRWLERHGEQFVESLAAQRQFRRERELAGAGREHDAQSTEASRELDHSDRREPAVAQSVRERLDAGLDPF